MALTEQQVVANELEAVNRKVPTLFDREGPFYAEIEKRPAEVVSARDMRIPLEMRPGGNFGHFDPAGGDMGRGDGSTYDKALINVVYLKHGIEWQTKAQWATDAAQKSIVDAVRDNTAKGMKEFRRNLDSLMMTDGTGVIGTVSAISTGGGKDTLTLATDGFGARLLRYGQYHSIYNAALSTRRVYAGLGAVNGEGPIDLYDGPNKQVRVNSSTGATIVGDKLVVSGLTATPPVSLFGVPYHHSNASTGFWLQMDRSANPEIRANRVAAASAGLALPFPRLAMNKVGDRVGQDQVLSVEAWMHPCQVQAYEDLGQLVMLINKESKEQGLNLYFNDNMQMAGAPVRKHFSWDKTRIDFIAKETWGRCEMKPAGIYEVGGRRIFEIRGSSGGVAASQIFYLCCAWNAFVMNPAACVYIDQLAVPSGY